MFLGVQIFPIFTLTVKFLKIWTPKNIAVITLKFKQSGSTVE